MLRQLHGSLSPRPEIAGGSPGLARLHLSTRVHRLEKLPCHLVNNRVRGSRAMQAMFALEGLCYEVMELLPETYKPRQILCPGNATMTCCSSRPTHLFKHLP